MTVSEPQQIVDALVGAGWQIVGQGQHHVRLEHECHHRASLLVPTDPTAPEYGSLVEGLALTLVRYQRLGDAAREALNTMHREGVAP